jgi:hypothetical protein
VVLLAALMVLGVVGTLLVASYFTARRSWERHRVGERAAQLHAAADGVAVMVEADWDSAARFRQAPASAAPIPAPWSGAGWRAAAVVTRVSFWTYRASVRVNDARDTSLAAPAASLLIVRAPRFPVLGALVAVGDVNVEGSLAATPSDSAAAAACGAPAGWGDGIVTAPDRTAPAEATTARAAGEDSTYSMFGGLSRAELVARADVSVPAGAAMPVPIGNVVHALGDLELTGGSGSGVLVVDGMLAISGTVTFRGVIVVAGAVEVSGGNSDLSGTLLVGGRPRSVDVNALASMRLRYDPCIVRDVEWHAGAVGYVSAAASPGAITRP